MPLVKQINIGDILHGDQSVFNVPTENSEEQILEFVLDTRLGVWKNQQIYQLKINHTLKHSNLTRINFRILQEQAIKIILDYKISIEANNVQIIFLVEGVIKNAGHLVFKSQVDLPNLSFNLKAQKKQFLYCKKNNLRGKQGVVLDIKQRFLILHKGQVEAQPELAILPKGIKATHSLVISGLDPQLLYYLQSRGFNKKEAELLLTNVIFL